MNESFGTKKFLLIGALFKTKIDPFFSQKDKKNQKEDGPTEEGAFFSFFFLFFSSRRNARMYKTR